MRRIASVWIQYWYSRLMPLTAKIMAGGNPSSASGNHGAQVPTRTPVQVWRIAVDRLYSCEEWWFTCAAHQNRHSWLARWNT